MAVEAVVIELDGTDPTDTAAIEGLAVSAVVGVVAPHPLPLRPSGAAFVLELSSVGIAPADPRALAIAAAAAGCHLRELVLVTRGRSPLLAAAAATGCRVVQVVTPGVGLDGGGDPSDSVVIGSLAALPEAIEVLRDRERVAALEVGLGPHPRPWPDDPRLDHDLLASGDRRNVVDRYRYWREDEIVADLDRTRLPVHVAVENWQHDLNIGTVVRNANAYNVAGVHVIGQRRWNRRGAMATDRYLTVSNHPTVDAFASWAASAGLPLIGIDNVPGAEPIEQASLPAPCVLVFGQEGPGLSAELVAACDRVCEITQHGSTRSLNAGVASGIALYAWALQHAPPPPA